MPLFFKHFFFVEKLFKQLKELKKKTWPIQHHRGTAQQKKALNDATTRRVEAETIRCENQSPINQQHDPNSTAMTMNSN